MIKYHDIVFLERAADHPTVLRMPAHLRLTERHADFAEAMAAIERGQLRDRSLHRIRNRFDRGLRLFMIEDGGKPVAWCWMAMGTWRYIDELRWHIPLRGNQAWGRDAYVVPEARGQRLALVLMGSLHEVLGHPVHYFSDVDARNRISLRAHASAGFRRIGRVRALELGARRLMRGLPPAAIPQPIWLRPHERWLRLSEEELARHRDTLA